MNIKRIMKGITVEPVLFLYMFCAFMSFPLLQQLAYRKICHHHYNDSVCSNLTSYTNQQEHVQKETSNWMRYQALALTLPSIISSLVLGAWSDKVGRKFIMILPPIGNIIMNINYMLNVYFFTLDANFLLIGIFIAGVFGGFATTLLAVFSHMADITDKSQRTLRISILESMVFLGGSVGELVAGVLLDHSGFMAAFGLALAVNVCIIIYVSFVLQESYVPEGDGDDRSFKFVLRHFMRAVKVIVKNRPNNQRMYLVMVLFGALSFVLLNFGGFNDVIVLYCLKEPLHMSSSLLGYFLAEVFFIRGFGVMVAMPVLTKLLKLSDYVIAIMGMVFSSGMFVFFGLAKHSWMMFAGAVLAFGDGLPIPCMRSIMSKCVEPTEQGSMFAALACLEVLYTLLASLIFNSIYSSTVSLHPGFTFFLQAGILLIPLAVLLFLYMKQRLTNPYQSMDSLSVTRGNSEDISTLPGFHQEPSHLET